MILNNKKQVSKKCIHKKGKENERKKINENERNLWICKPVTATEKK